jgi:Uma2 family endonuclease
MPISVEEYLGTSFEDGDREYIYALTLIAVWFHKQTGFCPLISVRTRVSPTRFRVPDLIVVAVRNPAGRVITEPPFLAIEIISPEDRLSRMEERIDDYIRFGIRFIWVIDPKTGTGHIYNDQRRISVEDGIFWTEDPPVEFDFAQLSE